MRDDDRTAGRVVLQALNDALDQLEVARLAVLGFETELNRHSDDKGSSSAQAAGVKLTGAILNVSGASQLVEVALMGDWVDRS